MREVHLHRRLFSRLDLFCLVNVEPDWATVIFFAIGVVPVVRVIFAQLEPNGELGLQMKELTCGGS